MNVDSYLPLFYYINNKVWLEEPFQIGYNLVMPNKKTTLILSVISHLLQLSMIFKNDLPVQFVEIILEGAHVDLKSFYIAGTKIEVVVNRETFVWRKSVEKLQNELKKKMIK